MNIALIIGIIIIIIVLAVAGYLVYTNMVASRSGQNGPSPTVSAGGPTTAPTTTVHQWG